MTTLIPTERDGVKPGLEYLCRRRGGGYYLGVFVQKHGRWQLRVDLTCAIPIDELVEINEIVQE